jgi:WD40 repeat protein
MICLDCPTPEVLLSFHLGTLPDDSLAEVTAHVVACADCEEAMRALEERGDPLLGALRRQEPLSDDSVDGPGRRPVPAGLPDVPGYDVLGVLGEGGMGVVYRARHHRLGRDVALKRLHAAGATARERFQAEALAAALLQHPNIVAVYEVFDHQGDQYLALELVEGGSLERLTGTPLPPRQAAALVEALARAVQHAHERGVVHRDLKPANILLAVGQDSNPVSPPTGLESCPTKLAAYTPKVADFGIARHLAAGPRQTQEGDVIGTPAYMAPEQACGRTAEAGPAADVYSLGVLLYELLTGRPPLLGATAVETLQLVVSREPVPPRSVRPGLPRDLDTVCLKCLRKDPRHRYASAGDFADDLRRFAEGRAVHARPVGAAGRAWRWGRRNPGTAGLLAALVVVTASGLALVTTAWRNAVVSAGRERTARRDAEVLVAGAVLDQGVVLCERGNVDQGLGRFVQALEQADRLGDAELERGARLNLTAWRQQLVRERTLLHHTDWVWAVAFSPDGRTAVTGSKDGTARLWEVAGGQQIGAPLHHGYPVWAVAFGADGRLVLTGSGTQDGQRGEARLWDARTGKPCGPAFAEGGAIPVVAFRPDGKALVTTGPAQAQLWDPASRRPLGPPLRHPGAVLTAAFSPDSRWLLTGGADRTARLWDAATGRPAPGEPWRHSGQVLAVAFSPDGRTALTGAAVQDDHDRVAGGEARLWDVAGGRQRALLRHRGPVKAVAFGPDGRLLATGAIALLGDPETQRALMTGDARLWRADTGTLVGKPLEHPGPVWAVAFSPSGRTLLTGCEDGKGRLFATATGAAIGRPLANEGTVSGVAFSPDGRLALTASAGCVPTRTGGSAAARLWDLPPEPELRLPLEHTAGVGFLASDRDGRHLRAACCDGTVRAWDLQTGTHTDYSLPAQPGMDSLALAPNGRVLATSTKDVTAHVWDLESGQLLRQLSAPLPRGMAFAPDGRLLVNDVATRTVQLRDVSTGEPAGPPLQLGWRCRAAAVSPDGRVAALGGVERTGLWDLSTGRKLAEWRVPAEVWAAAFSPDGRALVTGHADGSARLWEVPAGRPHGPALSHPSGMLHAVAFSPDGRLVATGGADGTARVWYAATGKPVGPPLPHRGAVSAVAFQADARLLATGSGDGAVRLWPLPGPVRGDVGEVRRWVEAVTGRPLDDRNGSGGASRDGSAPPRGQGSF